MEEYTRKWNIGRKSEIFKGIQRNHRNKEEPVVAKTIGNNLYQSTHAASNCKLARKSVKIVKASQNMELI